MKKISFYMLSLLITSSTLFAAPYIANQSKSERVVESFTDSRVEDFPKDFRTYPFQRGKAESVYRVKQEGDNKYLNGTDKDDISVQTFKRFYWDTEKYPRFSWKWRAQILPKGANENDYRTNDSACGIYVVFGSYTGNVLKYVWSTNAVANTIIEKEPGKFYIFVLQSGKKNVGAWKEESVDVVADYKKVFKENPSRLPSGFGLLTDGNAVHAPASCDYDDFKILEASTQH